MISFPRLKFVSTTPGPQFTNFSPHLASVISELVDEFPSPSNILKYFIKAHKCMGKHSSYYLLKNYGIISLLVLLLLVYDVEMVHGSLLAKTFRPRLLRLMSFPSRLSSNLTRGPQAKNPKRFVPDLPSHVSVEGVNPLATYQTAQKYSKNEGTYTMLNPPLTPDEERLLSRKEFVPDTFWTIKFRAIREPRGVRASRRGTGIKNQAGTKGNNVKRAFPGSQKSANKKTIAPSTKESAKVAQKNKAVAQESTTERSR